MIASDIIEVLQEHFTGREDVDVLDLVEVFDSHPTDKEELLSALESWA